MSQPVYQPVGHAPVRAVPYLESAPRPPAPPPTQPPAEPYQVPPGTAPQAAREAPPEPPMVDQLAQDTAAADETVEYPPGCPAFRPLLSLPFDERAPAMRKYALMQAAWRDPKLPKAGDEVDAAEVAELYDALATMDRFLGSVAVDPAAYAAWPGRLDEALLVRAFNAYNAGTQAPEASSSSS